MVSPDILNATQIMGWNDNPYRSASEDMENLAYSPSGGRVKMIMWGVVLPMLVLWHAAGCWIDQEAWWFGGRWSSDVKLRGDAAKGMAVCWAGVAGFLHFRYFWGLWPVCWLFRAGVALSILLGLGGCGAAAYNELVM